MRAAVDFESFPSPARSQSDSTSRSDRPRTKAPITSARSGSVRSTLVARGEQPRDERLGGLADLRDFDLKLALQRLQLAGAKAVAQPPLVIRPALIAGPAEPGVELLFHGPLDDQSRPELGELRERLPRVLTHPNGKQLIDLLFRAPPTALRFFSRRRSPFLVLQDFGEPAPCP